MKQILTKKANFRGFTLIELLIFMGILSIILYVLTDIFVSSLEVKSQSQSQASLQQDSRYILSKLIYDLNRASTINSPSLGSESNSLEIVINGQTQSYSIDLNNKLVLTNNFGSQNLNGYQTQVSDLRFLHLGNPVTDERPTPKDNVQINFKLTSNIVTNNKQEDVSFQSSVGLR